MTPVRQQRLGKTLFKRMLRGTLTGLLVSCTPSNTTETLVLTGSSTVAPLASELGQRYESQQSDIQVDVQTGGSSRGIADARSGVADIGMASRDLTADEQDLTAHIIARDGITVILHEANPITSLTDAEIADIYTGEIDNWQEVGGEDASIVVVNKADGRATLDVFLDYFDLDSGEIDADIVIGDNTQGLKTVAGNPQAIGYISIGTAQAGVEQGEPIRLLPIQGVAASAENVANGTFPLARSLSLITSDNPSDAAQAFIDFAQSDAVHDLIEAQNVVPVQ